MAAIRQYKSRFCFTVELILASTSNNNLVEVRKNYASKFQTNCVTTFDVIKRTRKARNLADTNFYGNYSKFSEKMTLPIRIKSLNKLKHRHTVRLKFGYIFPFSPAKLQFEVEAGISSIIKENESAKLRALRVQGPTCFACLRAHLPICLAHFCAHVLTFIVCLRAHVATCLSCFVLTCYEFALLRKTFIKLSNLINSVNNFINNGSENENSAIKTTY